MNLSSFFAVLATIGFAVALIFAVIWIISAIRRKRSRAKLFFYIALLVTVSSFLAFGFTYKPDPSRQPPGAAQETPNSGLTPMPELEPMPEPSVMPEPTDASKVIPTLEPDSVEIVPDYNAMVGELEDEVQKTLDQAVSDRFAEPHITFTYTTGFALVKAEATENLTLNMTIKGVWRDIREILALLAFDTEGFTMPLEDDESMEIYALERVGFNIMAPGTDTIVIKAEFDKATIQSTDWDTVTFESVADLADWTDINTDYQLK